ncbi:MAG TPA: UDP-N-acetylglucosamine 1-carboxyvinyltransferase [Candidatus Saccharimonadales bacterium]|nr:UDP-N-acetylglucosamine 1-carboxyvinyltransferase [Candidatus Saccharimonadales bacterium]
MIEKFVVIGGNALKGTITVSGAKNAALKALVAACLTEDEVIIHNVPLISDFFEMIAVIKGLGGTVVLDGHTIKIHMKQFSSSTISLEKTAKSRTSAMLMAPLLARTKEAIIPNPGGCRLGARPIDRHIEGLKQMQSKIIYDSEDGYFHATTEGLQGTTYRFDKNTHTGTETLIIAAALAKGTTILQNAALEPEIDDLIALLNAMGAKITRSAEREVTIDGVEKLHGAEFTISPDRNEIVTFAIGAILTKGDVFISHVKVPDLKEFLEKLQETGGGYEEKDGGMRFFYKGPLTPTNITTTVYPGFMTDWQAPWAVLMTQANGTTIIHETVFENKLGYAHELKKMGAEITFFNPDIENKQETYNFNLADDKPEYYHAISISGPTPLHDAVVMMLDIRAGATLVLAALAAKGETIISGVEKLDRGYENFETRLASLGANIKRIQEEI